MIKQTGGIISTKTHFTWNSIESQHSLQFPADGEKYHIREVLNELQATERYLDSSMMDHRLTGLNCYSAIETLAEFTTTNPPKYHLEALTAWNFAKSTKICENNITTYKIRTRNKNWKWNGIKFIENAGYLVSNSSKRLSRCCPSVAEKQPRNQPSSSRPRCPVSSAFAS